MPSLQIESAERLLDKRLKTGYLLGNNAEPDRMFGNLGLHVIQFPSGKHGFVGRVPAILAYTSTHRGDLETAARSGPGIARKIAERQGRSFETRVFSSQADAIAFATEQGFSVSGG